MTTLAEIQEMRERRAKVVAQARDLRDQITDDTDDARRAELEQQFDRAMAEADDLRARIDREQRLFDAEQDLRGVPGLAGERPGVIPAQGETDADAARRAAAYDDAFLAYLRYGSGGLQPEQMQVLREGRQAMTPEMLAALPANLRAQSTSNSAGGYSIPTDTRSELIRSMEDYGGVRPLARVLTTASGNQIDWPTVNDTSNKAAIVSEGTSVSDTDITFGTKAIGAFMYRTMVTVSWELLMDSTLDLDALIREIFAERLFLGSNEHFTTGTGSGQPNGIVTASAAGYTASGESGIIYEDLVELEHSVKRAYRRDAAFMLGDNALKIIKRLKDNDGRPLWVPGLSVREPDTILGYPYGVNEDMADVEGAAKSVVFGMLRAYLIRDAGPMLIRRLEERYAENAQTAFILYSRHDGELMTADATTHNPVKHLVHPS